MRKDLDLPVDAEVQVEVALEEKLRALVASHADAIARDVRATRLAFVSEPKGRHVKTWDVEGSSVVIAIQ